ncbi:hypothetical protein FOXG_21176 [Fusarium oxysporum f. sp. lycopersici 4287]|uniref:Uncharacterized protein n=1 Tax=Fusarium oxysporum f. sp. lycopersici (strain 4287 / CBS 123668 / FGSC 9935 / NRRL 34936) TaxID=426428 RepID=A0A0J9VVE6_FUSO4|nr:hypothetical protein FOXG_21176 [Fusarium oxysporum f. sp. lycopersici 4287]KNB14686.1 hypothetical protein FOXG_21176 [Fusarium oxysporum f. sp. lycopersici 4287]
MAPSTISKGSEVAVPTPFNKIGGTPVQTCFHRIRDACGKWPWELFHVKHLPSIWSVYVLQKLHQAIKLAHSSPKVSLEVVLEHLERVWIAEQKIAISQQGPRENKQRKMTEKEARKQRGRTSVQHQRAKRRTNNAQTRSANLEHNRHNGCAKSIDANLVRDVIVVAQSPSPSPQPRQNNKRDLTAPPSLDLSNSHSEPLSVEQTESQTKRGDAPAPKRQKASSLPPHTPRGTLEASHKGTRIKDLTDDESTYILRLNNKTTAIRNNADRVRAQQIENENRLKALNSSQRLLQQELNTAQADLTRIRQDIQDNNVIRDSILRIIQRRVADNADGWNIALERCDKSLKVFEDDSKKTMAIINHKKQEIEHVDEMVASAKLAAEQCAEQAEALAAHLDQLTRMKSAFDVLKVMVDMGPLGLASLGGEKLTELERLVTPDVGGDGKDVEMREG